MNELEKEISEERQNVFKKSSQYLPDSQSEYIATGCFQEGVQFIVSKSLPVLFAEFLATEGWRKLEGLQEWSNGDVHKTTSDLYNDWENNHYGKV